MNSKEEYRANVCAIIERKALEKRDRKTLKKNRTSLLTASFNASTSVSISSGFSSS